MEQTKRELSLWHKWFWTAHCWVVEHLTLTCICFQVLLPPCDDSVSVPLKQAPPPYVMATAWTQYWHPAGWSLLLMKALVESYAPHCLSSVQYICGYIVTTDTHTHTHYNTAMTYKIIPHMCAHTNLYHHRDLSSCPGIYYYFIDTVTVCAIPEMICIWCIWTWM